MAAGAASPLPLDGAAGQSAVLRPGTQTRVAEVVQVLPGFFEAAAIPVLRGRLISAADVTSGDAAVVSEAAARALFPGRDALGESFAVGERRVAVVGDAVGSLTSPTTPRVYVVPGDAIGSMSLVLRIRTREATVLAAVKRAASALTPTTPVNAVWWEDDISGLTAYRNPRFQTIVLATFAALALGLTALGIVAVITFQLAARRKELGIRLALGSSPGSLRTLVLKQTLVPVAAGLVLGLVATRGLARLAEAQLYAVQTHDPITLALAAVVVTVAAIVSAYVPARRAGHIDPVVTLRAEV